MSSLFCQAPTVAKLEEPVLVLLEALDFSGSPVLCVPEELIGVVLRVSVLEY